MQGRVEGARLRVGLLGTGGVAAKYASLYGEYPRSELVIAFDPDSSSTAALSSRFGSISASSAEEVIAADVDAVIISTPNRLHLEQASAALNAGKHVLLQKPMTVTAAEADSLQAVADGTGRVLAMYMNSLDNPVMRDMRRMVAEGVLGRVGGVNCKLANGMGHVWRNQPANFWRGSKAAVGGGSFAMLACHYLNLSQWLLDTPIVAVTAVGRNLMSEHIEGDDNMAAIVEFDGGAMGVVESSWCVKGEQMSLHGSTGSVAYLDNSVVSMKAEQAFSGEVIRYETPGVRATFEGVLAPQMGVWENPHNQHRAFVDALLDGTPVHMPGRRGVQDMRVLAASYRSSDAAAREVVNHVW